MAFMLCPSMAENRVKQGEREGLGRHQSHQEDGPTLPHIHSHLKMSRFLTLSLYDQISTQIWGETYTEPQNRPTSVPKIWLWGPGIGQCHSGEPSQSLW